MAKISKLKSKYKPIYRSLKPVWYPPLNRLVYFNNYGWNHFRFHREGERRGRAEVTRRMKLIPYIPSMIKLGILVGKLYRNPVLYYKITATHPSSGKAVVLILRRVKEGKLHYFSAFYSTKTKKRRYRNGL